MGFREILVQVGRDEGAARRTAIATDLARRFGAGLVGAFLEPVAPGPFLGAPDGASATVLADLTESQVKAVQADAAACRSALEAAAQGLDVGWTVLGGWRPDELTLAARASDLLIKGGPPINTRGGVNAPADIVALDAGVPVLVVPDTGSSTRVGKEVLVAWNGSREATRAMRDALPLLTQATRVVALIVDHPAPARDGEDILPRFLRRHGCRRVDVYRLPEAGQRTSEVILRYASHEVGSDLIVMGLYGHSRLRESILGGVSRDMLEDSPIPLLLSH